MKQFAYLRLMKAARTSLTSSYSDTPSLLFSPCRTISEVGPERAKVEVDELTVKSVEVDENVDDLSSFPFDSTVDRVLSLSLMLMPSYPTSHRWGTVQCGGSGGAPEEGASAWAVPNKASPRPDRNDDRIDYQKLWVLRWKMKYFEGSDVSGRRQW